MLRISNISKHYGETLLFEQVSLTINEGEKIGVVGANGSGKSTLLKILAGLIDADTGHIHVPKPLSTTYLPQQFDDLLDISVGSYLAHDWFEALNKLKSLEREMQKSPSKANVTEYLLNSYATAFAEFEANGGYELENRLNEILASLGIANIDIYRNFQTLSGGERTKVALGRLLLQSADLMMLDEPTNNLDQAGMEWLERNLQQSKSAYIIVSHDRTFLDRVTTRTLEIDRTNSRITNYSGNYSWFRERKRQEEDRQLRQFKEQQIKIKKLTADIQAVKHQALTTERSTQNDYLRGRSKKVAAKAKARETRLTKILDLEKIESPRFVQRPKISLSGCNQQSSNLIEALNLTYKNEDTILSNLNLSIVGSSRIAVTGDNGSGKSTLLKLLVGELAPSAGTVTGKNGLRLGYLPQHHEISRLADNKTVIEQFKALIALHDDRMSDFSSTMRTNSTHSQFTADGEIRTLLHRFQFAGNDVFKKTEVLSRGERTKLVLASFMACNLDLIIMDEPTNHLDLETIDCLEQAMQAYHGAMIVVSHDRYFLEKLSPDRIWHVHNKTITEKWILEI